MAEDLYMGGVEWGLLVHSSAKLTKPGIYIHNFYEPSCYLWSVLYQIIRFPVYTLGFKYVYTIFIHC